MKTIDGSILEGGGQILRNTGALSAITCQSVEVSNIRAGRAKPGLAAQHLTGLRLVNALSTGHLVADVLRSTRVELHPQALLCGGYTADIGTAGAVTLLAQAALPCTLFARPTAQPPAPIPAPGEGPEPSSPAVGKASKGTGRGSAGGGAYAGPLYIPNREPDMTVLHLMGGTNADMAPPADYMAHVLVPILRFLLGVDVGVDIVRRGFYPQGGGIMRLTARALTPGTSLPAFQLVERGQLVSISINVFTAGKVAAAAGEAMLDAARAQLRTAMRKGQLGEVAQGASIDGTSVREGSATAFADGGGLIVVARTSTGCILGASAIHVKGNIPEATAAAAVDELIEALSSGACVDQWLQDQLVVFMALARGTSRMLMAEPTLHTRTAMVIAESLTSARFKVFRPPGAHAVDKQSSEQAGGSGSAGHRQFGPGLWLVECTGAGWVAPEAPALAP